MLLMSFLNIYFLPRGTLRVHCYTNIADLGRHIRVVIVVIRIVEVQRGCVQHLLIT